MQQADVGHRKVDLDLAVGFGEGDRVLGTREPVVGERQRLHGRRRPGSQGQRGLDEPRAYLRPPVGDAGPRQRPGFEEEDVTHLGCDGLEVGEVGGRLDRNVLDRVRYVGHHGRDGDRDDAVHRVLGADRHGTRLVRQTWVALALVPHVHEDGQVLTGDGQRGSAGIGARCHLLLGDDAVHEDGRSSVDDGGHHHPDTGVEEACGEQCLLDHRAGADGEGQLESARLLRRRRDLDRLEGIGQGGRHGDGDQWPHQEHQSQAASHPDHRPGPGCSGPGGSLREG